MDCAALAARVARLRTELERDWAELGESERGALYRVALARVEEAGEAGLSDRPGFMAYEREQGGLLNDVLALAEREHPDYEGDMAAALDGMFEGPTLKSAQDIRAWLDSLDREDG